MRHPPTITCGRVQPTARNPVSSSAGRAFPSSPASQACAPLLAAGAVPLQAGGPDGGAARSAAALPGPDGSAERTAAALPELDGSAEPTAAAFPRAAAGKPAEIAAVTGPGPDGKLARIPAAFPRAAAGKPAWADRAGSAAPVEPEVLARAGWPLRADWAHSAGEPAPW